MCLRCLVAKVMGLAAKPLQQNNSTDDGRQLLVSTMILQGQRTSSKQLFILMSTADTVTLLSSYNK